MKIKLSSFLGLVAASQLSAEGNIQKVSYVNGANCCRVSCPDTSSNRQANVTYGAHASDNLNVDFGKCSSNNPLTTVEYFSGELSNGRCTGERISVQGSGPLSIYGSRGGYFVLTCDSDRNTTKMAHCLQRPSEQEDSPSVVTAAQIQSDGPTRCGPIFYISFMKNKTKPACSSGSTYTAEDAENKIPIDTESWKYARRITYGNNKWAEVGQTLAARNDLPVPK